VTRSSSRLLKQSPMRRAIARAMSKSKREAPHFYVGGEARLDDLFHRLAAVNDGRPEDDRISLTAVLVHIVADALVAHPHINAHWTDDGLLLADEVHVGVAVAVADGLIAPAILDCAGLDVLMISRRLRDLADRARIGKLRVDEINQPTFTISNLGMYEVSRFTAILNPPQVAILATGAAEQRAVVVDGVVVPGSVMAMTLSVDHRAIDGIAAAQFLATVRRGLEMPSGLEWGTAG